MPQNETYQGNRKLKRSYVQLEWTKELVEEFVKCSKDPIYFVEKYVKIVHVDRGLINFVPYEYQKDIIDLAAKERFVICKMPRQCGKTTTIVGIMLHAVLFQENYQIAILANKERQAREILGRIQLAYENLPKWLQQGIVEWNKGNVELENGSKILASSTSSSAIRGTSQNLVYLDEFAFVPNNMQEEFFASVYPTISSGQTTKVLITSTPNGLNQFYKIWADSEQDRNSYKRIEVHWSDVPGRDEKWKEETIKNTSEDQFRVEFECEFVGSSSTLINGAKLRALVWRDPIKTEGHIKIYKEPEKGKQYCITVDTARGRMGDYSAFVVFDINEIPYRQIAIYRNQEIDPLVYPNVIKRIGDYYNQATVLIETNDIGQQVADILYNDLEYENLVFTSSLPFQGTRVSSGYGGKAHPGIRTTKSTKKVGCSNLKSLIENDKLVVQDYETIQELMRFVSKGTSFEAEDGNDDLAMCCVMFSWLADQSYFRELTDSNLRENMYLHQQQQIEDELTPFGIINDGFDETEPNQVIDLEHQSFEDWMRS
ncbi:MAG: terminase [Proteobacteria bacterium]|nr:terminase [Pseudomonadota bacterium]